MELYIEPERLNRDVKGRFVKGNKLRFKRRKTKKMRKAALANLKKARATKGRKGKNRGKPTVGINKDGTFVVYPSARYAENLFNVCRSTISNRCRGIVKNRLIAGKLWYYECDTEWMKHVKQ